MKKKRQNETIKGAKQALNHVKKSAKSAEIKALIYELTCRKERKEENYRQARDDMHRLEGEMGELQCIIWKLEELK